MCLGPVKKMYGVSNVVTCDVALELYHDETMVMQTAITSPSAGRAVCGKPSPCWWVAWVAEPVSLSEEPPG